MAEAPLLRTALFEEHQKLGARFVPFSGYEMPVQYSSIVAEHEAVREHVGVFDVSHMGISYFRGPRALAFIDSIVTRDLSHLNIGQGAYTLLCHDHGGTVDDLIVYRTQDQEMLLVFNASNKEKDFSYFSAFPHDQVDLVAPSPQLSLLAIQGPRSPELLRNLGFDRPWPKPFEVHTSKLNGISVDLLFTGYTGELGCEVVVKSSEAPALWRALFKAGASLNLLPCGLGARDTLRLEMGYSLYGHELSDAINPVEAGLSWAVGWSKPSFVGKDALITAKNRKKRSMIALRSSSRQAPRQGMTVLDGSGKPAGEITSGTFSPTLGVGIALALVDAQAMGPFAVELRPDKKLVLELCKRPFVNKEK